MSEIRKIYKKDIPALLDDEMFWKNVFLPVSRHRLLAHFHNPDSQDDDVVLLLAYDEAGVAGYMGVYLDKILLDGKLEKIGWLSTWWVHPRTKGSGIGREILNTMYETQNGKIGISQFTPSAKRVYDKSGYFYDLKKNVGIKAVLKSNLALLVPQKYRGTEGLVPIFRLADWVVNAVTGLRFIFQKAALRQSLKDITIQYMTDVDNETQAIIQSYNANHISPKGKPFFGWLKSYHWVEDAPLAAYTEKHKYEFSMYDKSFDIYMMKIMRAARCIGFIVLQKRGGVFKLLFAYYDAKDTKVMADIIKLQAIVQDVREIVCYDKNISDDFRKSSVFLYKRKKTKHSIISKVFGKTDFDDVVMNFGDGDCSFA